MVFIYLLLTGVAGLGLWAVGALALAGHLLESFSLLVLLVFSVWCAAAFAKRTPRRIRLPFVGFCAALALEVAGHMAGGLPPDPLWAWINFLLWLALGPFYLHFVTQFPLPRPRLKWLVWLAYGLVAAVAVAGPLGLLGPGFDPMHPLNQAARLHHFTGGDHGRNSSPVLLVAAFLQVVGLCVLWGSHRVARAEQAPRAARQALVLILGAVLSWLPLVGYIPGVLPAGMELVLHGPPAIFLALGPIAGASALRHPDFYDQRGLFRLWLIGIGVVSGAYLLYVALVQPLTLLLDLIQPGFGREPSVFGAALVVALLFRPMKEWITERVDHLFYPHLLGFRTLLQETSQALATTIVPVDLARLATESLPARLGVAGALLLVLDDLGANLVSLSDEQPVASTEHAVWHEATRTNGPTMLREEAPCAALGLTAPALVLPLRVGGRLVGVYVLGARQPGVDYTRDELGQLMVLGHHLAIAVENGRALRKIDELSQRAVAEVEERNLLAREIHDTIAQGLTAASLQLDVVQATLTSNPAKAAKATDRAQRIVRENLSEARRSVLELRAPLLGTESLPVALNRLLSQAAGDIGASGAFQLDGTYRGLPARMEHQFYRITQEALHNAVKYSSASHLIVNLHIQAHRVSLTIADDGAGFDTTVAPQGNAKGGFGLNGMGERARLLGGQLRVLSEPGEGTMVKVTVPLHQQEGAEE